MINLEDLVEENEVIAKYHVTFDGLATRECIINKDSDDISGALEDTLHRILDNGGNEDDVWRILGAKIPEEVEKVKNSDRILIININDQVLFLNKS